MIRFVVVQGPVIVHDKNQKYLEMAVIGMTLNPRGSYLLATTDKSSFEVETKGSRLKVGPSSFLRIRGDRSWWDRHSERWTGDAKLFIGRIWAKLARDSYDTDAANAAIGVRG